MTSIFVSEVIHWKHLETRMHSSRMHTVHCSSRSSWGEGVSARGGLADTPSVDRMTDTCENITHCRLRTVKTPMGWPLVMFFFSKVTSWFLTTDVISLHQLCTRYVFWDFYRSDTKPILVIVMTFSAQFYLDTQEKTFALNRFVSSSFFSF